MPDRTAQFIRNLAVLALIASAELIGGATAMYWVGWIR